MQKVFAKNQSQSFFFCPNAKQNIFTTKQPLENSFSLFYPGQQSKFKIPKVNTEEAKSIFLELNKKNCLKQLSSKKNWKFEETSLLIYLVEKFSTLKKVQNVSHLSPHIWNQIQEFLPGRSAQDCKYKVLSLTASTITNIPWSIEERNILNELIEEQGMNWNIVSQRLYERSDKKVFRTSKQCREHYMCFLKPNLKKGAWTEQQDYKLVCYFLEYGRKWSKIMKFIDGRNENSIKNRFFLLFQNKGKTSNHSDLLRKVKRKKQRMEKSLKDKNHDFMLSVQEKSFEQITSDKNWEKIEQIQLQKSVIEAQTKKGEDFEFQDQLVKCKQKVEKSSEDYSESFQCRNPLSLNNIQSYQHLDEPLQNFGNKQILSIEALESFEQYICF